MDIATDNAMLLPGVAFLLITAILLATFALTGNYGQLIEARIRKLGEPQVQHKKQDRSGWRTAIAKLFQMGGRLLLTNDKANGRLQTQFLEAGINAKTAVSVFIAARCLLALVLPLLVFTASWLRWMPASYAWLGAGLSGLIGYWLPRVWLDRRRKKRQVILRRALPDFLDLIVACLGGGLSVQAALKQVAEELRLAHRELAAELLVVLKEMELGRTLDSALQQFAARTNLEELRTLCSFVHQTTKFGTTITDALGQLAEMLRIQREQRAEELAQKAAVKILFPTLIFIFPTVFVVLAGPAAIQIREGLKTDEQQQASPTYRK